MYFFMIMNITKINMKYKIILELKYVLPISKIFIFKLTLKNYCFNFIFAIVMINNNFIF